jgi:thiol-disulfide isomerase/thioredoxin
MAWFGIRARAAVVVSFAFAVAACGSKGPDPKLPDSEGKAADGPSGPAEVGKPAPALSLQSVNGKGAISLESLSGKVAIVDFWATWCGPCKQSFPKLEELAKQNSGKVQVVGISVDDKSEGVADFAKANGGTFAVGWDDGHAIANRWKVDSMPTTYILDGSGKVRFIHAGYHDGEAEVIAKELATLSNEPGGGKSKDATASATPATGTPDPAAAAPATGDDATADKPEATPPAKPKKGGKGGKPKPAGKKPAGKKPAAKTDP